MQRNQKYIENCNSETMLEIIKNDRFFEWSESATKLTIPLNRENSYDVNPLE